MRLKKETYFYPKLKGLRNEKGYTMEEFASLLGITKNCYFKKENGLTDFYLCEIRKILDIFNCKYEDIFLNCVSTKK